MLSGLIGIPVLGHLLKGIGWAACYLASVPPEVAKGLLTTLGIPCP